MQTVLDVNAQPACNSSHMEPDQLRNTLAKNLRDLILRSTPAGERFSVRAWALGKDLEVGMIDRIIKSEHAVNLDTLEKIAAACNLKPWQLLLEDFDPEHPHRMPITPQEQQTLNTLRSLLGREKP